MTPNSSRLDGAALLRSVGLLVDGPGQWGRPVAAPGPGVFVVELVAPLAKPPIELTRVGKWIERVDSLHLDGIRPTSRALVARLAAFWLPSQTVLYIGRSETSIARRLAAMAQTELGDRQPQSAGHWLKTLRGLEATKIWWALTSATEEYEDALFDAFAAAVPGEEIDALSDRDVVLPFANLRRADARKTTGLSGSLLGERKATRPPPTFVRQLPDGDADGAHGEPPAPRRRAAATRVAVPAAPRARTTANPRSRNRGHATTQDDAESLTAEGAARLQGELDQLVTVRRPDVIARIRTAKEHGDLKENAEYHAAREEQSFLEGRIQALEARLRSAVIVEASIGATRVGLGSKVTVEAAGETDTYVIVGQAESDPTAGRISSASPVGRALIGREVDEVIVVRTPAGDREYRILEIA